jgi:hypothetical protein
MKNENQQLVTLEEAINIIVGKDNFNLYFHCFIKRDCPDFPKPVGILARSSQELYYLKDLLLYLKPFLNLIEHE